MGNDNEGTEDDNEGTEDDNADNDDEGHNEDNNLGNNKLDNDEVKDNDGNDLFPVFACFLLQDLCIFWQLLDPSMPSFWALALCIFFTHFFRTLFEFIQAVWLPCGSCLPPSLQK